jgi:hypothetical protein
MENEGNQRVPFPACDRDHRCASSLLADGIHPPPRPQRSTPECGKGFLRLELTSITLPPPLFSLSGLLSHLRSTTVVPPDSPQCEIEGTGWVGNESIGLTSCSDVTPHSQSRTCSPRVSPPAAPHNSSQWRYALFLIGTLTIHTSREPRPTACSLLLPGHVQYPRILFLHQLFVSFSVVVSRVASVVFPTSIEED